VSSSDDDLRRFVAASFPSVWALELLLLLKREQRPWTATELLTALRASELVISKALDALVAAGLASLEQGGARYLPASRDTAALVERVEQLYLSRPNQVRRLIVAGRASSAVAFADAFRLRRDENG